MHESETYIHAPNKSIRSANGITYAYRELGGKTGIPIVFFTHLSANLDNWDPRIIDGIAKQHWVITFDNKGVGLSSGQVPGTIKEMAEDAIAFIKALGFSQIDILSLSMGGMIAQELLELEPTLIRKVILTGTGPRGGKGIEDVAKISNQDLVRAIFTLKDVKTYLFFTNTATGKRKAKEFLARIKERKHDRDKMISLKGYHAQLRAIHDWGKSKPADLSKITHPTLVVNGEADRMVPTENSYDLVQRLPNSKLVIYEDAGHGAIFQYHEEFTKEVIEFLGK
ncbi:alpha/beta fold hydrolase [Trichococcus pasteurii]|uniref:Alpha/beta hydrolase fold-1 n=1 Tax=Trichococcus pasteurii TaxID=43064 RepID=A0A1W1IFP8_9LACT|nr:alpha/beta hydrolase [Trichococcus pasteurii]SFE59723.1 Pimeloyl-ACP methyl ester carboxylesterase [Trichococcus pasteurii]SLM51836.1 alpha/beta hydrolase fold-1 [Trichococcus pasteurii]SSB92717.1 alpha/beta hydrolase fold-1 [Trichococcus pasteurii]